QAIFRRLGFDFRAVMADSGNIGGNSSHEFHVLADSGEDAIVFSDGSDYAANMELASALPPASSEPPVPTETLQKVATPNTRSIEEVCALLGVPAQRTIKTLIVLGQVREDGSHPLVALVLRGDHQLNEVKAAKLESVHAPLCLASEADIVAALGCKPGSIGP